MTRPARLWGAVLVTSGLATAALGQSGAARPVTRSVSVFVDETWTDNVQFLEDAERDSITRLGARAELKRTRSRGELAFSADAAGVQHAHTPSLDQLFYGGRFTASHQLSRRTSVRVEEGYRVAYAGDQRAFTELAALEPLSRSRTQDLMAEVSRQLSRRASTGLAVRHTFVAFEDGDASDGHRLALQARLDREASRHGRLRLHADREWSWLDAAEGVSRVGVSWSGRFGTWQRMEAGGGAVGVDRATDLDVQPFGAAGVGVEGATGSVVLRYERSVGAAFGVGGLQAMDYVAGRASWRPWRHVQADVELSRAVSRSSGSEALLASMDHAQASLKTCSLPG